MDLPFPFRRFFGIAIDRYDLPDLDIEQPVSNWAARFLQIAQRHGADRFVLSTTDKTAIDVSDIPPEKLVRTRATQQEIRNALDELKDFSKDAVEKITQGMNEQLSAIREEEIAHREKFLNAAGAYLPEDLCPFVSDMPTVFEVTSGENEVAVDVESQYVTEVRPLISVFSSSNIPWRR